LHFYSAVSTENELRRQTIGENTMSVDCFKLLFAAVAVSTIAFAQDATNAGQADAQIAAALKQVSAKQIQATVEKLVSFQTRLTLSAQDPQSIAAGHGIGAARDWIKGEFERYSQDCGGCLESGQTPLRSRPGRASHNRPF
jgi:hypothetical protein